MLAFALPRRPTLILLACGRTQWGALGRAKSGEVILVEAKAHVSEILSPGSQALEDSLPLIRASVGEAATGLGALPGAVDWSQRFYQYTNRLAHAYLSKELNGVPTLLVFLYFIGDREMGGPESRREWDAALAVLHEGLGLRARLPLHVKDVFVNVLGK